MDNHTQIKKKGTPSSIYLPVDVVETILSRLTVKSLVRFKTVSKTWHDIISNPGFSRIHHQMQQSKLSKNLFLLWAYRLSEDFLLIKLENQRFRTESVLEYSFGPAYPLCSCNGVLLLLLKGFSYVFVLWNPSIRRYYDRIVCPLRPLYWRFSYGLYYDSRIDDYKVVIISKEHYTIYSCKNTSWADTKTLPFSTTGLFPTFGIFVDGSFYWRTEESYQGEIVCFDVRDEKSKKLSQPSDLKLATDTDEVQLTSLSGRLCLYRMNRDATKLQLWVMEMHGDQTYSNYSWRELMNKRR